MLCKLKGTGHCKSAKRMTSILRDVAEAFPAARQGTILNSNRVVARGHCYQYLNGDKLHLSDLHNDDS